MADLSLGIGLNVDWASIEKSWAEKSKAFAENNKVEVKLDFSSGEFDRLTKALTRLSDINAKRAAISKSAAVAEREAMLISQRTATEAVRTVNTQNLGLRAQERHEEQLRAAKLRTQKAELSLNNTRGQSANIIVSQNRALQQQGFMLNGLKQFAGQYLSVLGSWRLFDNIRRTTADFEVQRVALRSILQDIAAADKIFSQTLDLAITSPFTALELNTYTKQLAAYRIETESLFDVTKRLADVSAGLGVDMSRLIIAYGQVRAASVLRGQEIRQFTEAGIPLIELLAEKFTKLKGEVVSTSDVFDLVSRRKVPFEMVAEIFKDMTNEGGVFYNMQEIRAKTLQGIYANLSDNIQQAFARIGNSQMGILKGTGQLLTEMAKNLEVVISAGLGGVAMWLLYRQGINSVAASMSNLNKSEIAQALALKQKNAQVLLQSQLYRNLSKEEQIVVATRNRLTAADISSMKLNKAQSSELIRRMYVTGKLNKEELLRAVRLRLITGEEIRAIKNMTSWERATLRARMSLLGLTNTLKSFFITLASNPMTWITAIGSGIYSIYQEVKKRNDTLSESNKRTAESAVQMVREMRNAYGSIEQIVNRGLVDGATAGQIREAVNSLEEIVRKNKELNPTIDRRLRSITDEATKLLELKRIYEDIIDLANNTGIVNPFAAADFETDRVFLDKSFSQNVRVLYKEFDQIQSRLHGLAADGYESIEIIYKQFLKLREGGASSVQLIQFLEQELANLGSSDGIWAPDAFSMITTDLIDVRQAFAEYARDASRFIQTIRRINADMTDEEALRYLKEWSDSIQDISDEMRTELFREVSFSLNLPDYTIIDDFKNHVRTKMNEVEGEIAKSDVPQLGFTEENYKKFTGRVDSYVEYLLRSNLRISEATKQWFRGWNVTDIFGSGTANSLDGWRQNFISLSGGLFTAEDLSGAKTFAEEIDNVAKRYKDATEEVNKYQKAVDATTGAEQSKHKEFLDSAKAEQKGMKAILDFYGQRDLIIEKSGSKTDPRIAQIKEELKIIQEAYKRYQELQKLMSDSAAQEKIKRDWANAFASFTQLKGQQPVFDASGIVAAIDNAIAMPFIDPKTKLELRADKIEIKDEEWAAEIQKQLDLIAKKISLQSILDSGMKGLSTDLISGIMELGISEAILLEGEAHIDFTLPFEDLIKQIETIRPKLNDATRKMLEDYIKYLRDSRRKEFEDWNEYLIKYGTQIQKEAALRAKYEKLIEDEQTTGGKAMRRKEWDVAADELQIDMLKQSEMWIRMFGDAERVTTGYIKETRQEIQSLLDYLTGASDIRPEWISEAQIKALTTNAKDATEVIKQLTDAMDKQSDEFEKRNPFTRITEGIKKMRKAADSLKTVDKTSEDGKKALNEMYDGTQLIAQGFNDVAKAVGTVADLIGNLGIEGLDTFASTLSSAAEGAMAGFKLGGGWGAVAGGILGMASGLMDWITGQTRINKEIEKSQLNVQKLENLYKNLNRAVDQALGLERYRLVGQQIQNLYQQQIELERQAQLERSRGSRRDNGAIEDYEQQAKETIWEVEDLIRQAREDILGGDAKSIAADLGTAFFDALRDGSISAKEAWNQTVDDIIDNLVRKMLITKFLEEPIGKLIDGFVRDIYNPENIDNPFADDITIAQKTEDLRDGLDSLVAILQNAINGPLGEMLIGPQNTNLTGISKSVGQMTEDTALTLAAIANSGLYYQIGMYNLMVRWDTLIMGEQADGSVPMMTAYQSQALATMNAIKLDTAGILAATQQTANDLRSVISASGTRSVNGISIN